MECSSDFDMGKGSTLDCIRGGQVLSSDESNWRPLLSPEALEKKPCCPTSGLSP